MRNCGYPVRYSGRSRRRYKTNRVERQRLVMDCIHFSERFRRCVICTGIAAGLAAAAVLVVTPSIAKNRSAVNRATAGTDSDYVSALSAANRFLQAWQNHDEEAGLLLLTDTAKHHTSADSLDAFFSTPQNAYEIRGGKRLQKHRYCFSVVLFSAPAGRPQPLYAEMIVLRTGKDEWVIDNLPKR